MNEAQKMRLYLSTQKSKSEFPIICSGKQQFSHFTRVILLWETCEKAHTRCEILKRIEKYNPQEKGICFYIFIKSWCVGLFLVVCFFSACVVGVECIYRERENRNIECTQMFEVNDRRPKLLKWQSAFANTNQPTKREREELTTTKFNHISYHYRLTWWEVKRQQSLPTFLWVMLQSIEIEVERVLFVLRTWT